MVDTGKLLGYLELYGFRTQVSPCAETVEDIVKLDAGPGAGIDDGLHNLPELLQEADYPVVCVTLGDQ